MRYKNIIKTTILGLFLTLFAPNMASAVWNYTPQYDIPYTVVTPIPVVTITASPTSGTVNVVNPSITWSATNSPTSCNFTGDWTNTNGNSVSGTNISQGVLTQVRTYTYTLTCSNAGGSSAPASATVVVSAAGTYNLTVSKAGTGSGTVTGVSNPVQSNINCGGTCGPTAYSSGTTVTLTPSPTAGSTFAGWSGDLDCSDGSVTMNANKSCTATFTLNTYTITATAGANGSVSPIGVTTVSYGGSQSYTITPNSGYSRDTVLINGVNNPTAVSTGSYTFSNVQANNTIHATFIANPQPQCNDSVDNDGDTLVDFPADPGCVDASDDDETNSGGPQCDDRNDNDGDLFTDYPADPGCYSLLDDDETDEDGKPECSDGHDNDLDGKIDFGEDPGCESEDDDLELNSGSGYTECSDGNDNDGDSLVDYPDDPGCTDLFDDDEFNVAGSPTADISASPNPISLGQNTTLTWTSTNSDYCTSNFFGGNGATSGSQLVTPPALPSTYTITCVSVPLGQQAVDQVTVSASVIKQPVIIEQ